MEKRYRQALNEKLFKELLTSSNSIKPNKAEDFPFTVEVEKNSPSQVSIITQPDVLAASNELIALVSSVLNKVTEPYTAGVNNEANRKKLQHAVEQELLKLWLQGFIKPKQEG